MVKKLSLIVLSLIALGSAGVILFRGSEPEPKLEIHGIYLDKVKVLTPFALTQTDGKPYTDQNLQGHWSLVFFGFTYCPDICPTTLALLNAVTQDLETPPQVVFVSVDPARDNLAQLHRYVHYFNPNFIAVTGEQSQLQNLARQLGVVFDKIVLDPKRPNDYLMEHSTSIALINPDGAIQAIFTSPHEVNTLVSELRAITKAD